MGYTPWDLKELDMTEQPTLSLFTSLPPSTSLEKWLRGFWPPAPSAPTPPPHVACRAWGPLSYLDQQSWAAEMSHYLAHGEERAGLRRLKAYLMRC